MFPGNAPLNALSRISSQFSGVSAFFELIDLEAIRRRLVRGQLEGRLEEARLRVGGEERPWPTASTHALRRTVRAHRGAAELLAPAAERQALIDETRALLARYEESR